VTQIVERFAKLPRSQRLLLVGVAYLLIALVFYFSLISPTMDEIESATAGKHDLEIKRDQVRTRAENRAAFETELDALAAKLKQALKELPNGREIPGLLSEIDGLARKSGLDVRRFQPLPEVMHEYFAEVPVQLVMDGSYHEFGIFFDRVSKMSRIVSVQDIQVTDPTDSGSEVKLKVTGKSITYRFLTDEEIEQNRNKPKKEGGGAGE
jgi:type IV pilus assembly protein PilO